MDSTSSAYINFGVTMKNGMLRSENSDPFATDLQHKMCGTLTEKGSTYCIEFNETELAEGIASYQRNPNLII